MSTVFSEILCKLQAHPKADDRRTIKSTDFVGRFYRMTKNRPIFVWHTTDKIGRFYGPILMAINSAVEFGSYFAEKIAEKVCHWLKIFLHQTPY